MIGISISSVRINGKDMPVNTVEELQTAYDIIGVCLKVASLNWNTEAIHEIATEKPLPVAVTESVPSRHLNPLRPPMGERSIDYARRAVISLGQKFTCLQLSEKMMELGWKTRATDGRSRSNTVRATIRDEKDFINYHDGFWGYVAKQDTNPSLLDEQ